MKNLQLSIFNFLSPVIIYLNQSSAELKDLTRVVYNIEGLRQENIRLRSLVTQLISEKSQTAVSSLNDSEKVSLQTQFESSKLLKNKKISIKKIIFYDSFQSKLILENSSSEFIPDSSIVIIGDNIVGLVESSKNNTLEVNLISSTNVIVNTNIINNDRFKIKTVLSSESGDSLIINNILSTEEVLVGNIVVTSNSNERILPDLIVGTIQRVEGVSSQTFRKAYVEKNYDLNIKNYVGILIND
jgi:cell shape-determining protein MreC